MIDFTNIGNFSLGYNLLMPYYRFAIRDVFYRECCVVGRENIPPAGTPFFVIANHQNSLNDALILVCMYKDYRQSVFLARGDVFKKDSVAKIFRFFKVMPTFRSRDGERADIKKNMETFEIASKILKNGGVITMFPEAEHQHGRYLGTFKKGVPRICLGAEEAADFQLNLQILPVNLHYSNIHNFREKSLIEIGKPFGIKEILETFKENPNDAYIQFNEKARHILKSMVLDIEDKEHYEEYNLLREMIRRHRIQNNYKKYTYYDEFKEEKKVIEEIDALKEKAPAEFKALMTETKEYADLLKKLNFRDWLVNKKITGFGLAFKSLLMILFSPFFIFGMINNGIPCYFAAFMANKVKDKVFKGSIQCVIGFLFFPIWYLMILIAASLILHSFIMGISYAILAFISLFVYYRFKVKFLKMKHLWRYFLQRKREDVKQMNTHKKNLLSRINSY